MPDIVFRVKVGTGTHHGVIPYRIWVGIPGRSALGATTRFLTPLHNTMKAFPSGPVAQAGQVFDRWLGELGAGPDLVNDLAAVPLDRAD